MINVNKYIIQTLEHFDSEDNSLGFLNESESNDLRCQIAENQAEGYYLVFNKFKINIQPNGKIDSWPEGLYDVNEKLLSRLFRAQRI